MGTESFRLFLLLQLITFPSVDNQQTIRLSALYNHSFYSSIHFALEQVNSYYDLFQIHRRFSLNETEGIIHCDVGTGVKTFFDMYNHSSSSLSVLLTDACQNVLSYISEISTHFQLPVISFTDSDLSLSAKDRYPYFYHIIPSDHAHNLVRKQLLQYFNWTRFGLIYQHGSKYTLVANDFVNLTALDTRKQFEVNLTRGLAYRQASKWHDANVGYMQTILRDFKKQDVRIIIANFNQTIATHMFCQAAREKIYGSLYQWIILGYPSLTAWWYEPSDCSMQELVRALNGTLQTRIPRLSIEDNENRSNYVSEYLEQFSDLERDYFDAYAYDTIWSLAYMYQSDVFNDPANKQLFRIGIENIDFIGATGRVRYLNGGRVGEVLVEQFVACRMMKDGTCTIPCYAEEEDCNLTVVKIFLAKHLQSKEELPMLYKLNRIMWHGNGPPRDRTNQTIQFEHIYVSVFISISICSAIGLIISCTFLAFNIHFRMHRYIRMSSPLLNNLILGGCMLAYISIILMGINSALFPTDWIMNIICPIRVWILCISFTLAFGSMFSKTWRVHSIFTNINITKKGIHDSRLLAIVALLLFIDLIFLILWQIFDPIVRQLIYDVPYRLKDNQDIEIIPFREECKSKNMSLWVVLLVLYKGLLMFYGSFLSWETRHVTIPALNDSRYIGLSVYIVFICCTLGSLVIFIPSEQIQFSYFVQSFFIVTCTTATVCLVFVPKIIEVYRDPHSRKKQPRVNNRLQESRSRPQILTSQHLTTSIIDNQQLKLVFSMQEQTLTRLSDQLNNLSTGKMDPIEPFELERLIVSDEEDDDDDDDDEEDDDEFSVPFLDDHNMSPTGRVIRAVSLCLFNQIPMGQLQLTETNDLARYSIPSHASPSKTRLRPIHPNSTNHQQTTNTKENDIEQAYDGLMSLDENRLEELIETDLVSSTNA